MGIIQYPQVLPGQVGVVGATKFMVSTDNLATITTAGYLNNPDLAVFPINSFDVISCLYSFNINTNVGTFSLFTVTISNGVITLNNWSNPGDVLLPVVSGDFASFNGTSGQIKDSGISPSNPNFSKVASIATVPIIGNIATYTDLNGTIGINPATAVNNGNLQAGVSGTPGSVISFPATASSGSLRLTAANNSGNFNTVISNSAMGQASTISIPDPGTANANFLLNTGSNQMASGSKLALAKSTGVESAGAVTINAQAGVITTSSLTTTPGTRYLITFTNSFIESTSVILLSYMSGTNTVPNIGFVVSASSGSAILNVYNLSSASNLDGTILIGFTIF